MIAMMTAEATHHQQIAWITNNSRDLRYNVKATAPPERTASHRTGQATAANPGADASAASTRSTRYPTAPIRATSTPRNRLWGESWTVSQAPVPHAKVPIFPIL